MYPAKWTLLSHCNLRTSPRRPSYIIQSTWYNRNTRTWYMQCWAGLSVSVAVEPLYVQLKHTADPVVIVSVLSLPLPLSPASPPGCVSGAGPPHPSNDLPHLQIGSDPKQELNEHLSVRRLQCTLFGEYAILISDGRHYMCENYIFNDKGKQESNLKPIEDKNFVYIKNVVIYEVARKL